MNQQIKALINNPLAKPLIKAGTATMGYTGKALAGLLYYACKKVTDKIEAKQTVGQHQTTQAANEEEQRIHELLKRQQGEKQP